MKKSQYFFVKIMNKFSSVKIEYWTRLSIFQRTQFTNEYWIKCIRLLEGKWKIVPNRKICICFFLTWVFLGSETLDIIMMSWISNFSFIFLICTTSNCSDCPCMLHNLYNMILSFQYSNIFVMFVIRIFINTVNL